MNILAIRLSSLGDVVLATSALRWLKERRPGARITFLTKAAFAPLLEGHPDIDALWVLDNGDRGLTGAWRMASRIHAARFDAVLDLHASLRSRFFGAASGARVARQKAYAWNRRLRVWAKFLKLPQPPDVTLRGVQAAAELIREGAPDFAPEPRLAVSPGAAAWADDFISKSGLTAPIIAVAPGASHATKRWPAERIADAVGRPCLIIGGGGDVAPARLVAAALPGSAVAAGLTSPQQLAALLARSSVLLCNDSGPMHVARALGVPVVALFGPTIEAFGFFPRGPRDRVISLPLPCKPCSVHGTEKCPITTHACMTSISSVDVSKALHAILEA